MKNKRKEFGTKEATTMTGMSFERLRYWEQRGIIEPRYIQCGTRKFRKFSPEDIERAVKVKKLVDENKYSLEGAIRKLNFLKKENCKK